jgi:DNA (cytosine-5)-methyltransferase 1
MIFGGPPCQGFSVAGKRDPADPRNNLIFEFARLIVECRPKTMCMENVTGITSMVTADGLPVLETFCRILEEGGFSDVDLIRRSMQAQGLTLMRGGRKPKKEKASVADGDDEDQFDLFEAAE